MLHLIKRGPWVHADILYSCRCWASNSSNAHYVYKHICTYTDIHAYLLVLKNTERGGMKLYFTKECQAINIEEIIEKLPPFYSRRVKIDSGRKYQWCLNYWGKDCWGTKGSQHLKMPPHKLLTSYKCKKIPL